MKLISCNLFDRHGHRAGQSKMVYYRTYLQSLALLWSLSHLTSSRGARNDASKIENNKTQQTTIKFKQPSFQDARYPIHRVRIPHSKFSSPKTCRNVHENSLKIGHTRLTRFFSFSNAPMTPDCD